MMPDVPERLAVAVSGGRDSIALLHMIVCQGHHVTVLHVNHGVRSQAMEEAIFVQEFSASLGVPCFVLENKQQISSSNFEQQARDIRYGLLADKAKELGISTIAIGHHGDDVEETVFLKLLRGSTRLFIPKERLIAENVKIIRPLLGMSREEIDAYIIAHNLSYKEDPSNNTDLYRRNIIRHHLIPVLKKYFPDYSGNLHHASSIRREEEDFFSRYTDQRMKSIFDQDVCPVHSFLEEDPLIQKKILQKKMRRLFQKSLTSKQINVFLDIISDISKDFALLYQSDLGSVYKKYRHIVFYQKELEKTEIIVHNNSKLYQCAPYWNVSFGVGLECEGSDLIALRQVKPEDKIPWSGGSKSVSQWLKDQQILSQARIILKNNQIAGILTREKIFIVPEYRTNNQKGLVFTKGQVMKELKVLFSPEQIEQRVREIATQINAYIGDDEAVIVANLKGAIPFYADLFRCLTGKVKMDILETQSYVDNQSSGHVKLVRDLSENVEGKKVIIIEDILDTGLTFEHIINHLKHFHNPLEVKICVLLDKKENRKVDILVDWIGFQIPNHYVVGYGLDDNQFYRNLPYIGYWQ